MLCAFFDIRYSTDDIRNHENGLKYGIVYIKNLHRIVANHQQRLACYYNTFYCAIPDQATQVDPARLR